MKTVALAALTAALWGVAALAQVDCPADIPSCRIADRGAAVEARAALMRECISLTGEIKGFQAKCAHVEKGSALAANCVREQATLQAKTERFEDRRDAFDDSLKCIDSGGERLPIVSPCQPMPGEAAFLDRRLAQARDKRGRDERQLTALQRDVRMMNAAARDVDAARAEAIMESASNALDIIDAGIGALAGSGGISPQAAHRMALLITTAKAGVAGAGAAAADRHDAKKSLERSAEAVLELSNLTSTAAGASETREALLRGLGAMFKLVRASEALVGEPGTERDWSDYLSALDDVIAATGQFLAPVRVLRATGQIVDLEAAQWHLARSRDVIDSAFVKNSAARRFYLAQIAQSDELIAFYEQRRQCVGR